MKLEEKLSRLDNYIKKQKLIGDELLKIELYSEIINKDTVKIIRVSKGNSSRWLSNEKIDLVIPSFVDEVETNAFEMAHNIETISFEKGSVLRIIGVKAFRGCSVKKVDFSNCTNGIMICSQAFSSCLFLKGVVFNNIQYIGRNSFSYNRLLKEVNIKSDNLEICDNAFYTCENLEKVNIIANKLKMNESVFYNCRKLTAENKNIEYSIREY